jgi:hypothetical protein
MEQNRTMESRRPNQNIEHFVTPLNGNQGEYRNNCGDVPWVCANLALPRGKSDLASQPPVLQQQIVEALVRHRSLGSHNLIGDKKMSF